MEKTFVIDKDYTFYAIGSGLQDSVILHVQCDHEEAMKYGKYFSEEELEDDEIGPSFGIKDQLDEKLASEFAAALFEAWKEGRGDEADDDCEDEVEEDCDEEETERTIDDFYEDAWDRLSETYYYYCWSPEFIKDCKEYYQKALGH